LPGKDRLVQPSPGHSPGSSRRAIGAYHPVAQCTDLTLALLTFLGRGHAEPLADCVEQCFLIDRQRRLDAITIDMRSRDWTKSSAIL
jgi:hypothetical protein